MRRLFFICFLLAANITFAQDDVTYKTPPKEILDLVMAKPTPGIYINNKGDWMVLLERSEFPTIEEMAQPELRIGGLRLNPKNFGPSRNNAFVNLQLQQIGTKKLFDISGLPEKLRAGNLQFSPDEKKLAFVHNGIDRIDLYVVDIETKAAKKINKSPLNTAMGGTYTWAGNDRLIYKIVPEQYRKYPGEQQAPRGPVVQENLGKAAASRTYQDLLKNAYDEDLFDYMATSQLVLNDMTGETKIGAPTIYRSFSLSPDKNYLLLQTVSKPFSYLVPAFGFPHEVSVVDLTGKLVKTLAKNPSTEGQPIGFDDASTFPRNFSWRDDEPNTVVYVQALDKGLGRNKSYEFRDAMMSVNILAGTDPKELFKTKRRLNNVIWGNATTAIEYESMTFDRKIQMNKFNPSTGEMELLFERSSNDAYSDIGFPMTAINQYGRNALIILKNGNILLRSQGSSPQGDMPFVQQFDLKNKKGTIIWRCEAPYYETVIDVIDPDKNIYLTSRESQTEVPNYYLLTINSKKGKSTVNRTAVTDFKNPYPQLEGVVKQKISYKRDDGIDLTGDLYLPKGYNKEKDGPLPVVMWAYPREYKSAADAAQVRGSKYTFTRVNYGSPIFWITQGYAVLDNAEMPIVGEGTKEPNDNFIPQLHLNAHAAIQALAKMGVGDSNRVAVGGHSYGAFMTANLLAHTKLFKAGIARSGAYNRTLTPFGFQAEERTYWEAPEVYYNMSPFMFANNIKTPLLMIHGEMDNNSGTFPIQSERLYNAIKGHGGTVRFVILPYESHGYAARENILHMLWEQDQWLNRYVKNYDKNQKDADARKGF
ncbi:MAG TPA: prolyl oligopeptidase family serine peptidase [Chitinophagaceae bacterium]|nr:prolyl oligopeptidase family serine peptidase [Chitinophagaceae bacterium]